MIGLRNHSPVEARGLERCRGVGIGYCCAARWVIEASEFIAASRRNGFRQTFLKIAEEEEWCFRAELLAHEKQGRKRCKQKNRRCGAKGFWICDCRDPFSEGAVADLIMILQERDKRRGRQTSGGFTAYLSIS